VWEGAPNQHVTVSMVHAAHDLLLASSLATQSHDLPLASSLATQSRDLLLASSLATQCLMTYCWPPDWLHSVS